MGPVPDLALRAPGLGEIVDRSVALARRHFRALFVAMLAIDAPALVLGRLQQARAAELLELLGDPERAAERIGSLVLFSGEIVAGLLAVQLAATAAAAAIVAPSLDPSGGERPTRARRAWAVVTATLVQGVAVAGAPVLGAGPGLLLARQAGSFAAQAIGVAGAAVGAVTLLGFVVVRLVLVPAVAAIEGRGGLAAALRSSRLMAPLRGARSRHRPGQSASLVLFAAFLLALAANGLAGLPRALAGHAAGVEGPLGLLGATLPWSLEIPVSLFEAAATAALQPLLLVAIVLLYDDRRARAEAVDVESASARLDAGG